MGTDRYEIRRRIGSGSYGVVYEAYDRHRRSPVALKWLSYVDAEAIHRFKNEFRSLAEISHPNLVSLFDLSADEDQWFFTMELVRGRPLAEFLRPDSTPMASSPRIASPTSSGIRTKESFFDDAAPTRPERRVALDVDPGDVRSIFAKLVQGVRALHDAGKLHRDLKCQNVLVTPDGRVVLLDFGMVRELGAGRSSAGDIAGTPLYMAPEQCAGAPVDRPADLYAVGVMLFRALTMSLPFEGRMLEIMAAKQSAVAPRASERVAGVPPDLDDLCAALLARLPERRPSATEVLRALGAESGARVSFVPRATEVFVGRRRELRALEAARRGMADGRPRAVYVHGASGIGKTALVRHFIERLRDAEPDTLVLEGRCFERETLPYKALDSAIDDLAAYLLRLDDATSRALVPPHVGDLVRVFPALARSRVFAEAASPPSEAPDPQERRRCAILGLEELLRRLCRMHDVIIFIDDLQWGDRDSAMLVSPLVSRADAPPVMWLGTYRSDEASSSPYLSALRENGTSPAAVTVEVPELDDAEARTLLELRLSGTARDEALLDDLARDAAGSPLLIDLLVRHARAGDTGAHASIDLGAVLSLRMEELPEQARVLLEVLALRGQPLDRAVAAEVVEVDALDVALLTQLRNGRLIRAREQSATSSERLELYHDRIRETVSEQIDPARERELHRRLAAVLLAHDADAESLAFHFRGAGQKREAYGYTVRAARNADASLAFERAAALYRSALTILDELDELRAEPVEMDEGALLVGLADALRNAGRGRESAEAYAAAAVGAPPARALELRRLAAEQYLFSGHLDAGRAVLRTVLTAVDLGLPEHPARVLAELLVRRAQVSLRGLKFRERPPEEIPEDIQLRIDVCWSVSIGFAMVDPVRGGVFQARHLLMALDAGDLARVARAVAVEVPFSATAGRKNHARTQELIAIGKDLAERARSPYTKGLLASSSGGAAWLEGRWSDALDLEEEGLSMLRQHCSGVAWEMATSTIVLLDVLWRMGRLPELFERWPAVLVDASTRGDRLLEIYVRIKFRALSHLAAGRPDDAVRDAQEALAQWSQPTFQLFHLWELFVRVESQLYSGRGEAAHERLRAGWSAVRRSGLLHLQMYEITMHDLAGRAAVSCAVSARGKRRGALLSEARAEAKHLAKTGAPWAAGCAALLRAGAASVEGDSSETRRFLGEAQPAFERADMRLHALVVAACAARLSGDAHGVAARFDDLRALGLVEPERWLGLLAPGRFGG